MKKYFSDGLNFIATGVAGLSSIGAAASGHPEGAAFPAAVASITGLELYHPKNENPGEIDNETIEKACKGIYKGAFAKGVIATAGAINAAYGSLNGNMDALSLLPSVAIPLGLSATGDAYQSRELKKLIK